MNRVIHAALQINQVGVFIMFESKRKKKSHGVGTWEIPSSFIRAEGVLID